MLEDNNGTDKLLGENRKGSQITEKAAPGNSKYDSPKVNNERLFEEDRGAGSSKDKRKRKNKKDDDTQFTSVLKFFNIIIGLLVVAFGVLCYYYFNSQTKGLAYLGLILPGYIAVSGLLILLI